MAPANEYKRVQDFVLNDLWGFAAATTYNSNLKYLIEDQLGNPGANGHRVLFNQGKVRIGNAYSIEGDGTNPLTLDSEDKGWKIGSQGQTLKRTTTDIISFFDDAGTRQDFDFFLPTSGAAYIGPRAADFGSSGTPDANGIWRETILKAWGSITGGVSPTIDEDFNLSSITRNAQGAYTYTMATAMANSDYPVLASVEYPGSDIFRHPRQMTTHSTTQFRIEFPDDAGTNQDVDNSVAVIGSQ